jgi:hypothetical protein
MTLLKLGLLLREIGGVKSLSHLVIYQYKLRDNLVQGNPCVIDPLLPIYYWKL